MKDCTRRAIAYVVGRKSSGRNSSNVYDYSVGSHHPFGGTVNNDSVAVYDYTERCHVGGTLPNIYHYGNNNHINLRINQGGQFSGYDYDECCHFSGNVSGNKVSIYDYGVSAYFSFSI